MVAQACDPITVEADTRGLLAVNLILGHSGLYSKFYATCSYRVRLS